MSVFWIRHAESVANAGQATIDPATIPLTRGGELQSLALVDVLPKPMTIVTSSYTRARQTAAPTIDRHLLANVDIWPVHEFTYLAPFRFPTVSTFFDRAPAVAEYWRRCDPAYSDGPGVESFDDFIRRVRIAILALSTFRSADDHILIFGHGLFIKAVRFIVENGAEMGCVVPSYMGDFHRFANETALYNASISKMSLNWGRWKFESWNISSDGASWK